LQYFPDTRLSHFPPVAQQRFVCTSQLVCRYIPFLPLWFS